jgi:hypothetical protein
MKTKRQAVPQKPKEPAGMPEFPGKTGRKMLFVALLVFTGLFFAVKINLTAVDLGRHIKNGEMVLAHQYKVITTNFYSYTEPEQPFINHHWLSGVLFYLGWKWAGFDGLSFLYILMSLTAIIFFFKVAEQKTCFSYALFFTVLAIPLVTYRAEIRPEGFSYLFIGIYYYLLTMYKAGKIRNNRLWMIPVLQLVWVNLHIFFILGPVLISVFLVDKIIRITTDGDDDGRASPPLRDYVLLLAATILASFVNPFGIQGMIAPLTIFKEYGYMIAENQSVIFMQRRFPDMPTYKHFEALVAVAALSFIFVFKKKLFKLSTINFILLTAFSVLAWRAIRGIGLFGMFFVPIVAENVYLWVKDMKLDTAKLVQKLMVTVSIIVFCTGLVFQDQYYSPIKKMFSGLGTLTGIDASAEFFKYNQIQGPIFNNYDIGSYLEFYLFPQHRVFVDNRPEAYTVKFFTDTYVPMQEKEDVWKQMDKKFGFNCIYFYRLDITPWAQPFLIKRLSDPDWAPVFVDGVTLILVKRTKLNEPIIKKYELPKNMFSVTK